MLFAAAEWNFANLGGLDLVLKALIAVTMATAGEVRLRGDA